MPFTSCEPSLRMIGPVKVLAAESLRIPGPFTVRPPAPLMTPAIVRVTAEVATLKLALPPRRLNVWLLAEEPAAKVPVAPV